MDRRLATAAAVISLVVMACGGATAAWTSTVMQAVGTSETLLLTPSWAASGGGYDYSYALANNTAGDYIIGFTLALPASVPVSGLTSIVSPVGWSAIVRTLGNKVNWRLGADEADALGPGQTKTFGFSSTLAPGTEKNVNASSQDSFGFSGLTYGPVPEPGSLLALATGVVGVVGVALRRRS